MDKPLMLEPFQAAPDVAVLPSYFPVPGLGILPINAFLLKSAEPVLIDTGQVPLSSEFVDALAAIVNPKDIKWLWLTHTDQDHIGSLKRLLDELPKLRIVTSYFAVGKMNLFNPLPLDRVYLLNPGQTLDVGDRTLVAVRPPSYDAAETTGFYDKRSGAFFCADCFGALMSEPAPSAAEIGSERLRDGLVKWATIDSPWLHLTDRSVFAETLNDVRKMAPGFILSSHLPPADNMTDELLQYLELVPSAAPFIGPDQKEFESLLKGLRGK